MKFNCFLYEEDPFSYQLIWQTKRIKFRNQKKKKNLKNEEENFRRTYRVMVLENEEEEEFMDLSVIILLLHVHHHLIFFFLLLFYTLSSCFSLLTENHLPISGGFGLGRQVLFGPFFLSFFSLCNLFFWKTSSSAYQLPPTKGVISLELPTLP